MRISTRFHHVLMCDTVIEFRDLTNFDFLQIIRGVCRDLNVCTSRPALSRKVMVMAVVVVAMFEKELSAIGQFVGGSRGIFCPFIGGMYPSRPKLAVDVFFISLSVSLV